MGVKGTGLPRNEVTVMPRVALLLTTPPPPPPGPSPAAAFADAVNPIADSLCGTAKALAHLLDETAAAVA